MGKSHTLSGQAAVTPAKHTRSLLHLGGPIQNHELCARGKSHELAGIYICDYGKGRHCWRPWQRSEFSDDGLPWASCFLHGDSGQGLGHPGEGL